MRCPIWMKRENTITLAPEWSILRIWIRCATRICPDLMEQNDARQLRHITYGLLLNEKDATGNYVFRDDIYHTLRMFENQYY